MVNWVHDIFAPIIEGAFIIGIFGYITYVVSRAFVKIWQQQWKFILRYSIRKKPYPEKTVKWCFDAIESGIGYYDCKKFLMIKGVTDEKFYETLWIYDKMLIQLKGGQEHGRKYERISGETKETKRDLPSTK